MERSGLRKFSSNGPLNQFCKLQVLSSGMRKLQFSMKNNKTSNYSRNKYQAS